MEEVKYGGGGSRIASYRTYHLPPNVKLSHKVSAVKNSQNFRGEI